MQVWLNDRLVPEQEARVPVSDRGFTLGDGLFETMRVFRGRVFRLDAHLARLTSSAARIGIPPPGGLKGAVLETIRANPPLEHGAVRLTLTRGAAPPGLRVAPDVDPTLVIALRPFAPDPRQAERGVSAFTASGRIDEHAASAGLKRLGYLEAVLAQREADRAGADETILLDTAGHLAEAAAANLFLVRDGVVLTPPLSCGVLPGITRAAVLEIAASLGLPATERALHPRELAEADEAFLTSALRGITPLVSFDALPIGGGATGPVTQKLQSAYARVVEEEGVSRPCDGVAKRS